MEGNKDTIISVFADLKNREVLLALGLLLLSLSIALAIYIHRYESEHLQTFIGKHNKQQEINSLKAEMGKLQLQIDSLQKE